jgi:hypothetical protein
LLKLKSPPFAEIINEFLELGKKGLGCDVEIEFSANLSEGKKKAEFNFLQIRPIVVGGGFDVRLGNAEKDRAFCLSGAALGAGQELEISDIVFVNPAAFSPEHSLEIAREISYLNATLRLANRKYLLIGPGRWGSADRFLGIPVKWHDISSVAAIIELRTAGMDAEPSQGTHFFQNITSLGVPYLTIKENQGRDRIDWHFLENLPIVKRTNYLIHCQVESPFLLKIDGKQAEAAIFTLN